MSTFLKNIYFYIFVSIVLVVSAGFYLFSKNDLNVLNFAGVIQFNQAVVVVENKNYFGHKQILLNGSPLFYYQKVKIQKDIAILRMDNSDEFYILPETEFFIKKNDITTEFYIEKGTLYKKNVAEESKYSFFNVLPEANQSINVGVYNTLCGIKGIKNCKLIQITGEPNTYQLSWDLDPKLQKTDNFIEIYTSETEALNFKMNSATLAANQKLKFKITEDRFFWKAKLATQTEIHEGKNNFYSPFMLENIKIQFPQAESVTLLNSMITFKWSAENMYKFRLTIYDESKNRINSYDVINTNKVDLPWIDSGRFFWSVESIDNQIKSNLVPFLVVKNQDYEASPVIEFDQNLARKQIYLNKSESILGLRWKNISNINFPFYKIIVVYKNSFSSNEEINTEIFTTTKNEFFLKLYSTDPISVQISALDSNYNTIGQSIQEEFSLFRQQRALNISFESNKKNNRIIFETDRDANLKLSKTDFSPAIDYSYEVSQKNTILKSAKLNISDTINFSSLNPDFYELKLIGQSKNLEEVTILDAQKDYFSKLPQENKILLQKIIKFKRMPKFDLNIDQSSIDLRAPAGRKIQPKVEDVQVKD